MTRRTSQQHRKAPIERSGADRGADSPLSLDIGPAPRQLAQPDFPEMVAQARAVWPRVRETVMAEHAARPELPRPFGWFAFDRPPEESRPGPLCDALVAEGRLTAGEASMMGSYHLTTCYGAIRRAGATLAEWTDAPDLAARTLALCGWDPFTPERLAELRESDDERQARRHQEWADAHPGAETSVTAAGVTTVYRARTPDAGASPTTK
jgi:hypothetical protein